MKAKPSFLAVVCAALALGAALPAAAHEHHQHRAENSDRSLNQQSLPAKTTVAAAQKLPGDSKVVLEGVLVKKIAHQRYQFRDATGTIQVKIKDKRWNGRPVHAGQKLRLIGEVDHHRIKPVDIDVDRVDWL